MANQINVATLANQGPPGPLAASVANPAALGTVAEYGGTSVAWPTGVVAYVQSTKQYWTLDRASSATPDGSTVVAPKSGVGRWLLWSTQWSSPTVPVPTVAGQVLTASGTPLVPTWAASSGTIAAATRTALSATADASLPDGQPAFNEEALYRANWQLSKTSTLTADGVTVLATNSGTGRWILKSRLAGTVPVTEVGADPTGSVDSLAAVNAAAAALGGTGAALYFPAGTYQISAAPTIPGNPPAILLGNGATFTGAGATAFLQGSWGATLNVAPSGPITQTQPTAGGGCTLFNQVPNAASGGGPGFAAQLATETGIEGAENPAWGIGYNVVATPGYERAIFQIERNFQNATGTPNDTEFHLEFFDTNNVLVSRSFSSSWFFYPTPQVIASTNFRDGIDGNSNPVPGYFTVNSNENEILRVTTSTLSLEGTLQNLQWQFGLQPLITQQDQSVNDTVYPFIIRGGRSTFSQYNTSDIQLQVRATSAHTQGQVRLQQETSLGSGAYTDVLGVTKYPADGTTLLYSTLGTISLAPYANPSSPSTAAIALRVGQAAAGSYLWTELENSANQPATPSGGPRLFGSAGAAKVIGTSGTVTTFGAADLDGFKKTAGKGHCPVCGTDFALEWANKKYGALTICMRCLAEELGARPWIVRRKPRKARAKKSTPRKASRRSR